MYINSRRLFLSIKNKVFGDIFYFYIYYVYNVAYFLIFYILFLVPYVKEKKPHIFM